MKFSEGLEWYKTAKERDGYWIEKVKNRFAASIGRLMEHRGIKRKDLAAKLGVSPPNITKMLRGDANLRIDSMVKLVRALDAELTFQITPNEAQTPTWTVFQNGGKQARSANDLVSEWQRSARKGEPRAAVGR